MARSAFRDAYETMEEHWLLTAWLLTVLVVLSLIGGFTASSIARDTARGVCFAHHPPAECSPDLRIKSPEEVTRLNEMYLRCLSEHTSTTMACQRLYDH